MVMLYLCLPCLVYSVRINFQAVLSQPHHSPCAHCFLSKDFQSHHHICHAELSQKVQHAPLQPHKTPARPSLCSLIHPPETLAHALRWLEFLPCHLLRSRKFNIISDCPPSWEAKGISHSLDQTWSCEEDCSAA